MDVAIVRDIVSIVAQRRGIERQQPDRGDAELLNVVELRDKARDIADPVIIGVVKRFQMQLVDDGVLVPIRTVGDRRILHRSFSTVKIIAGASGSRRMRCRAPTRWRVPPIRRLLIRRSSLSLIPIACTGRSTVVSCGPNGSRLRATKTALPRL